MPIMVAASRMFNRSILGAVVLGFAALVLAVVAGIWSIVRTQELGAWVLHTYEVELSLADFRGLTERVETARRGFLIQPDDRFETTFRESADAIAPAIEKIAHLTRDNPKHEARIAALRTDSARQIEIITASIETRRSAGAEAAQQLFVNDGGIDLIRAIREVARQMTVDEQELLRQRRARQEASLTVAYVILSLAATILLVVAAGTIWLVRRNLIDLKASRDGLRDLNENLEAAVETRTADLRRANDEIQRFAYIVSHDLRSPLVNVMGFTSELDAAAKPLADLVDRVEAEAPALLTPEARDAVRDELPEAIGFIRSSTQKMDRLINAILRLSREGRKVIVPEPLEMNEIVGGIVDSLQHRLTELGAEVHVERPLPGLVCDRVAVEQIFSNLVENAVKYLKPGRPGRIVISGRRSGDRVVYDIEDNGRGIDPRDHERIFDLFRRSGAQDQPGEGIGLAHVRALAYRLGGTVACRSALDAGATFSISLPASFRAAKET